MATEPPPAHLPLGSTLRSVVAVTKITMSAATPAPAGATSASPARSPDASDAFGAHPDDPTASAFTRLGAAFGSLLLSNKQGLGALQGVFVPCLA